MKTVDKNYLQLLELPEDFSLEQLQAAYRKKALLFHPDRNGKDGELMRELNIAYWTLKDPEQREQYFKKILNQKQPTAGSLNKNMTGLLKFELLQGESANPPQQICTMSGWQCISDGPWLLRIDFELNVSSFYLEIEAERVAFPVRRQNWDLVETIQFFLFSGTRQTDKKEIRQLYRSNRDISLSFSTDKDPFTAFEIYFPPLPEPPIWKNFRLHGKQTL